ncbi:MAG: hypothetical protein ACOCY6_04500 [Halodesulfurarchaeum sp.]
MSTENSTSTARSAAEQIENQYYLPAMPHEMVIGLLRRLDVGPDRFEN